MGVQTTTELFLTVVNHGLLVREKPKQIETL